MEELIASYKTSYIYLTKYDVVVKRMVPSSLNKELYINEKYIDNNVYKHKHIDGLYLKGVVASHKENIILFKDESLMIVDLPEKYIVDVVNTNFKIIDDL